MQNTIFGHLGSKGPILDKIAKMVKIIKNALGTFFPPAKCEKPPFLGILDQKGEFWTIFGQNGKNGNFSKNRL